MPFKDKLSECGPSDWLAIFIDDVAPPLNPIVERKNEIRIFVYFFY